MELNAMKRPGPVADAHDFAFVGPCSNREIGVVKGVAANYQTVVACRLERIGQALKNALAVVVNERSLAVHDAVVAHDFAAEDITDALMAETYTQERSVGGKAPNHFVGDSRLPRCARTR